MGRSLLVITLENGESQSLSSRELGNVLPVICQSRIRDLLVITVENGEIPARQNRRSLFIIATASQLLVHTIASPSV